MRSVPVAMLGALLPGALARAAPADDAAIAVTAFDAAGAPVDLAGAQVRVTDASGRVVTWVPAVSPAQVGGLASGAATVEVWAPGYLPAARTLTLEAGAAPSVTLTLQVDGGATITVRAPTVGAEREATAEAVEVVETAEDQLRSADLGEVLARTRGVSVRRGGGLGSSARFSLAGLTDDQVRFFLDGVPLDLAGYPFGLANVPVDLAQRVEVYKGVVPVRFGADALGGAIDLVSETEGSGSAGAASVQSGSFGTHRAAVHHRHRGPRGLWASGSAWLDLAENDYEIDVQIPDEVGRLQPEMVRRFHDAYRAGGGTVELGVVDQPWAERLTGRGFVAAMDREIQHNIVMTVPYGEPTAQVGSAGGLLRYAVALGSAWRIDSFVGHTRSRRALQDIGTCVYDWRGDCVSERPEPGEIATPATDQRFSDGATVGRLRTLWEPSERHVVELSVSPLAFSRTGQDLRHDGEGRDPLTAQRDALQVVTGLEHTANLADDAIENRAFVKHYAQRLESEEPVPGGGFSRVDRETRRFGFGDGVRVDLGAGLRLKASYEWATRLPTPTELFGDGMLVLDNLSLVPETSHNANLGVRLEQDRARLGRFVVEVLGTLRETADLIVLLGDDRTQAHFNVFGARSWGAEGEAAWSSAGDHVTLTANGTLLDLRNTSAEGAFGTFEGDRIPNRPWMTANGSAQVALFDLLLPDDRLSLDWTSRYVHPFFRSWESIGLLDSKQQIPSQLSHAAALTWRGPQRRVRWSGSAEVQNLTNARLYDFFGVQRPGRAFFGKAAVGW